MAIRKKPQATEEKKPVESFESLAKAIEDAPTNPVIRVKFLQAGLSVLGNVWDEGEEVEIEVGGAVYESTKDIYGDSWLDLTQTDQESKWGKVFFEAV